MPRRASARPGRPSLYPRILFPLAIALQLLSSLTVAGIMFYFIGHLSKQGIYLPWMFYFLQGSALATIISAILLRGWSIFRQPVPTICSGVSGFLMSTWASGFGLLVEATHEHVTWPCTLVYWGNSQGITVCSLYKTLLAGAGVGFLSTLAVLVMDILAWKKSKTMLKVKGGEGLLGRPAGTEYKPVWSESAENPHQMTGLEPLRHERE